MKHSIYISATLEGGDFAGKTITLPEAFRGVDVRATGQGCAVSVRRSQARRHLHLRVHRAAATRPPRRNDHPCRRRHEGDRPALLPIFAKGWPVGQWDRLTRQGMRTVGQEDDVPVRDVAMASPAREVRRFVGTLGVIRTPAPSARLMFAHVVAARHQKRRLNARPVQVAIPRPAAPRRNAV